MELLSSDARRHYESLLVAAARTVVGLDFDGTLSPIVPDPTEAVIHPDAPAALVQLAPHVRAVAVVTGRPARQAVALGGLDLIGDEIRQHDRDLLVFGQYGHERWSTGDRRVFGPRPPHGLATLLGDLPGLLRRADAGEAYVEDKGLAFAVHTRRLPDPGGAFDRLLPLLSEAARRHGLVVEPGRHVVEVRSPGRNKGDVVHQLVQELDAGGFVFVGDDLGDVDAFKVVLELREQGLPTLLVCSASGEESALLPLADIAVPGPDGVVAFLRDLVADIARASG